jgi:hypothetical protein
MNVGIVPVFVFIKQVVLAGISMTKHVIPFLIPLFLPRPSNNWREAARGESSPVYNISLLENRTNALFVRT